MITVNQAIMNNLTSSVRSFNCKVEHHRGSTLQRTFMKNFSLQSLEIQRVADNSRFFGMVVCQRVNLKAMDINRSINVQSKDTLTPYIGVGNQFVKYPKFTITEVNRDENTNQLSLTGYDLIDDLKNHTVSELSLTPPYTITDFITQLATFAGTTYRTSNISDTTPFSLSYASGANFDGSETLREALTYVAEATQTVIFIDNDNKIVLKRMSPDEAAAYTITKSMYTKLSSKTNRRLVGVAHITELGDNVESKLQVAGTIQQVKDNPFWDLRTDIADIVDDALDCVGGLTINQFSCDWLGNLFLEVGDKIGIITKDNETVYSYILDDTITYNGSLKEKSQWDYIDDEDTYTNSTSIGDLLKQTYARVDKQQRTIDLHASNIQENQEEISDLKLTTNGIQATVQSYNTSYNTNFDNINGIIQDIRNQVATQITDQELQIKISQAIESSVQRVETETGFLFDKDGLKISKTNSQMKTIIDEDGMDIYRGSEKVLTADNTGVNAINLTARQYLLIGTHSRFEDYSYNRTGCFWID